MLSLLRSLRPSSRPGWLMLPNWYASAFVDSLLFVVSALDHCGVRYVAHRGTLLGALRLQGILPWDDDADVFVVDDDRASLADKLGSTLHAHGFRLRFLEAQHYFWAYPRTVWRLPLAGLIELGLLTASREPGTDAVLYDAHEPRRTIRAHELFPIQRYPFYGSYLSGPQAAEAAMERMYGALAEPAAFTRFERPAISAEVQRFWQDARPIDGPLDWERIQQRFLRRNTQLSFQLVQGPCSAYWIGNRCYWYAMDGLRVAAGGQR